LASNGPNVPLAVYLRWLYQPWPKTGVSVSTYAVKRNNMNIVLASFQKIGKLSILLKMKNTANNTSYC